MKNQQDNDPQGRERPMKARVPQAFVAFTLLAAMVPLTGAQTDETCLPGLDEDVCVPGIDEPEVCEDVNECTPEPPCDVDDCDITSPCPELDPECIETPCEQETNEEGAIEALQDCIQSPCTPPDSTEPCGIVPPPMPACEDVTTTVACKLIPPLPPLETGVCNLLEDPVECALEWYRTYTNDCNPFQQVAEIELANGNRAYLYSVPHNPPNNLEWRELRVSYELRADTLTVGAKKWAFGSGITWPLGLDTSPLGTTELWFSTSNAGTCEVVKPAIKCHRIQEALWSVHGGVYGWITSTTREVSVWAEEATTKSVQVQVGIHGASGGGGYETTKTLGDSYTTTSGEIFDSEALIIKQVPPLTVRPDPVWHGCVDSEDIGPP